MANYSLTLKNYSRKKGRAAVELAAYRAREKLYDKYYGQVYDYRKKGGLMHSEIILPPNAPKKFLDRSVLWNTVEASEKRKDSRLAKEVRISLPREFTHEQNIEIMREYAAETFADKGMIADFAIHDKNDGNPHTHILLTTRNVNENGFGIKNTAWDKKTFLVSCREHWAYICNRDLERYGFDERIDHRTLIEQGIDRKPTIYLGRTVIELKRKGKITDRSKEYDEIINKNNNDKEHKHERKRKRSRIRGR